jgi:8-oxo-dGTP pyrophosphatase MutT (NUDIX family)
MLQNLSPIQNRILSDLKNARSLRYATLRASGVPNDLFNYHLQHLVKKGFVAKSGEGYSLADKGVRHVADPFPANDAITSLFKINFITIVSRTVKGKIEILNQVRKSNPSYGKIGVMGGVVRKGEPMAQAAARKLEEETGLRAAFRIVGCERRMMYAAGKLFSDLMFPIAYADSHEGELAVETKFGLNLWVPIAQAIKNESAQFDSIRGIRTALKAIQKGTIGTLPFFFEEEIQSDGLEEGGA